MEVKMSFNSWSRQKLSEGLKSCTTRKLPMGVLGDTFTVDGAQYEIDIVMVERLGDVAQQFYKEEGATSPHDFYHVWEDIYGVFDKNQIVITHFFHRIIDGVQIK